MVSEYLNTMTEKPVLLLQKDIEFMKYTGTDGIDIGHLMRSG